MAAPAHGLSAFPIWQVHRGALTFALRPPSVVSESAVAGAPAGSPIKARRDEGRVHAMGACMHAHHEPTRDSHTSVARPSARYGT